MADLSCLMGEIFLVLVLYEGLFLFPFSTDSTQIYIFFKIESLYARYSYAFVIYISQGINQKQGTL